MGPARPEGPLRRPSTTPSPAQETVWGRMKVAAGRVFGISAERPPERLDIQGEPGLVAPEEAAATYDPTQTPAHRAAEMGDLVVFKVTIASHPDDLYAVDSHGRTPFHYAIEGGHGDIIDHILQKTDVDLDRLMHRDGDGQNPLHLALMRGDTEIAFRMSGRLSATRRTYCWTAPDQEGKTPLSYLESAETFLEAHKLLGLHISAVQLALQTDRPYVLDVIKATSPDHIHSVDVALAIDKGNADAVETLLKQKGSIGLILEPDHRHPDRPLFHRLIRNDDVETVFRMLGLAKDPFALMTRDEEGANPLHIAALTSKRMCAAIISKLAASSTNGLKSQRLRQLLEQTDSGIGGWGRELRPDEYARNRELKDYLNTIRLG
jgi:Ankyrin repeats (3 copies)